MGNELTRPSRSGHSSPGPAIEPERFANLIAELCLATGATRWDAPSRQMVPTITPEQIEVLYAHLRDIPPVVLAAGLRHYAGSAQFPGVPPIGKLRESCAAVCRGPVPTAGEAWVMVRATLKSVSRYDWPKSQAAIAKLPDNVRSVAEQFGWLALQEMPSDRARYQFVQAYERTEERVAARVTAPGLWPAELSAPMVETGQKLLVFEGAL